MNVTASERTMDDARREAARHREELAGTLDLLAARLGQTVDRAEETRDRLKAKMDGIEQQARRPLEWLRAHPLPVLGVSAAVGLLIGLRRPRRRRLPMPDLAEAFSLRTERLHRAYLEGRRDERRGRAIRPLLYWKDFQPRDTTGGEAFAAAVSLLATLKSGVAGLFHGARALRRLS